MFEDRMWRWLGCLWVLCAGCVSNPQPDIPQDAIVNYETVRALYPNEDTDSDLPDLTESANALVLRESALVGELSTTRDVLLKTMRLGNASLFHVVGLLALTIQTEPTVRTEEHFGWMFVGNRRTAKFTLSPQTEGAGGEKRFNYRFEVRPTFNANGLPFRTVMEGFFDRAPKQLESIARTGQGLLRFDFDALRAIDANTPSGQMAMAFRRRGGVLQVAALLKGVQYDAASEQRFSKSTYAIFSDGSGEFSFVASGDIAKDGKPFEKISVNAVWSAQGAGRAAVYAEGGSVAEGAALLIDECWADDGRTVWLQSNPPRPDFTGGAESDCAPNLQGLALTAPPPTPPNPGEDPLIPSPHPQESAE